MMWLVKLVNGEFIILFDIVGFIFDLLYEFVVVFWVILEEVLFVDYIVYV